MWCLAAVGGVCRHVSRDDIVNAPTPQRTRTWVPVPHHRLLDLVETTIDGQGYRVTSQAHGLWGDHGDRYFGLMELANGYAEDDYGLVLGLRNSHDKSVAAGLVLGTNVIVCSNGMFFGQSSFRTLHTPKIMSRLPYLINKSFGNILPMQKRMDQSIEIYKNHRTHATEVHDFLIRSVDRGVIPNSYIPHVLKEYRAPTHDEFVKRMEHSDRVIRTGWTLMNAYSEILKRVNPFTLPTRTIKLHEMLDELCQVPGLN